MLQMDDDRLDEAFLALADPVRRAIVARLSTGSATVNELAEPFDITKQAVSRHIAVLERSGLVTRSRDAQRRPVHLDASALERLTAWIDRYRLQAEAAYRRLDAVLDAVLAASVLAASQPAASERTTKEKES
ncbi:winged helix-turn-helix transcriptional regulator [Glaciibacter flavus]|uniref:Winged helix-turn-helix transcriptional regulator n=1 Tax=Orlajensenia flava TaxID=2565934 RepID=A0A4S4FT93_9MICO|nr:winged helix-turn-helix transcriptional regulator [Glaciibacter flavus]